MSTNNGKHIASQDVQLTLTMLTCHRFSMRREETRFSEGCGRDTSGAMLALIEEAFDGKGIPTLQWIADGKPHLTDNVLLMLANYSDAYACFVLMRSTFLESAPLSRVGVRGTELYKVFRGARLSSLYFAVLSSCFGAVGGAKRANPPGFNDPAHFEPS